MRRKERPVDWRGKVNPLLALAVHYLQLIPRFVRALAYGGSQRAEAHAILVDACNESLSLFPPSMPDQSETPPEDFSGWLPVKEIDRLLADRSVRQAIGEVAARIRNTPAPLLKKGLERPHWWMAQKSWQEFQKESHVAENMLNLLSLLQLNLPLRDLTQRVANGDSDLYAKLFRSESQPEDFTFDAIIRPLDDEATKIVGRALLRKGEPPGHQLRLRMMLYFGWDFGLSDLSIPELHAFLVRMGVISDSYDPDALRKYRDRLRRFINTVSFRPLRDPRPTSVDVP
jgi:hypothetical protein